MPSVQEPSGLILPMLLPGVVMTPCLKEVQVVLLVQQACFVLPPIVMLQK